MPHHPRPNGIVLQSRDYAFLRELLDSRLMTLKHAAALYFDGKIEAAKKRMQKLHASALIVQRSRRPYEPALYTLGRAGYLRLKQEGMLDPAFDDGWSKFWKRQQIGDLMLRHELAVMDMKAAFAIAIRKADRLELVEISSAPDKHKFRVVDATAGPNGQVRFRSLFAKPDGFIHIREKRADGSCANHFFYVEVDRGTESLGRLREKARRFAQFYRKGGFAVRLGHYRDDYRRFPFRVLMIFKTAARRDSAGQDLLRIGPSVKTQVWLATLEQLVTCPLARIWTTPRDYSSASGVSGGRSLFDSYATAHVVDSEKGDPILHGLGD